MAGATLCPSLVGFDASVHILVLPVVASLLFKARDLYKPVVPSLGALSWRTGGCDRVAKRLITSGETTSVLYASWVIGKLDFTHLLPAMSLANLLVVNYLMCDITRVITSTVTAIVCYLFRTVKRYHVLSTF